MTSEVQRWIENAANGIARAKPGYILKSSNELKALGDVQQAENVLRRAIEAKGFFAKLDVSSQGKILTNLCSLLKDKDPLEVLRIAEESGLKDPGLLVLQATALGRLDRHEEGIALLEEVVRTHEPHYDTAYKLAGLYMQVGRESDAVALLAPLVDGPFQDYLQMRQMLASAYIKTRKPDRAIAILNGLQDKASRDLVRKAGGLTGGRSQLPAGRPRVFVIYGHDLAYRELELMLHRIGAEPLVFEQLPKGGGMTVIELLEQYLPSADAVIALLTPDDEGRKRGAKKWELRARQNVLIEAGYAVLSRRDRSIIVALGGVSIPTDFEGIHRVQEEAWYGPVGTKVARRLFDMGLRVDPSAAT